MPFQVFKPHFTLPGNKENLIINEKDIIILC
jgi:hypothetical protein